jgi:hypothetical protein
MSIYVDVVAYQRPSLTGRPTRRPLDTGRSSYQLSPVGMEILVAQAVKI